jgi:hypothetical protein
MAGSSRALPVARRVLGWPARRLLDRRVEWILAALAEQFEQFEAALGESLLGHRLSALESAGSDSDGELVLPRDTARFLNWAEGPSGPAARAGLWFNPPVAVKYGEDTAEVLLVNERIVEQPYVFAALSSLPRPARILDVGGTESTVALSLATLGHEVHVVDPRGYPVSHPGIRVHAVRLDQLKREVRFDTAVALSSIEHFGLGAYEGGEAGDERLDLEALASIRERLVADGLLVLTVPLGAESSVDSFQRVYTAAELRQMLRDWELIDFAAAWRRDSATWVWGPPDEVAGEAGVGLIRARRG